LKPNHLSFELTKRKSMLLSELNLARLLTVAIIMLLVFIRYRFGSTSTYQYDSILTCFHTLMLLLFLVPTFYLLYKLTLGTIAIAPMDYFYKSILKIFGIGLSPIAIVVVLSLVNFVGFILKSFFDFLNSLYSKFKF